ncbi:unnamed protein product [Moneuplotes crassus]|uniref:3-beta hydroxysteroid dehydrogenase/isomerase domain-containing protein n=2 Tax=Euplotes crassus TaxID=5936 RepID=A0AAD1UKL7_EUPCR|nr:unnamed protein product [Moneuplotes crassus]
MERSKKVICLLGSTGFLGTTIVKRGFKNDMFRNKYKIRIVRRDDDGIQAFERAIYEEDDKKVENDEEESLIRSTATREKERGFLDYGYMISDITDRGDLYDAIKGSNFVIHCASSYPEKWEEDKDELKKTNEDGLQAVLDVCLEVNNESESPGHCPKVERLIYTSDLSTILDYDNLKEFTEDSPLISEDSKLISEYTKSKIRCEKILQDHIQDQEKCRELPVVILRPANMVGRFLVRKKFTSGEFMKKMLYGMFPGVPKIQVHLVSVDQVADDHLVACDPQVPANTAYCLYEESMLKIKIGSHIKTNIKNDEFHPSSLGISKFTCILASFFITDAKIALKQWGKTLKVDFTNSRDFFTSHDGDVENGIIKMCSDIISSDYKKVTED